MTGGKQTQTQQASQQVQFDSLRQYITAKEVAHKRLGAAPTPLSGSKSELLKRSNSSGTCNADERRENDPTVTIEGSSITSGGASHSAVNSPRFSSSSSSASTIDGRSSSGALGATATGAQAPEFILKVVLIGDSGVGKSNLVMRFTKNKYQPKSVQTVGFEFATKMIRVGDRRIKAQIWDTAGQERFQSLTAAYYRNAVGAMIVYDITNRSSFEHVTGWLAQVHEHSHENLVLILVGNKCDLAHLPQSREVSTLEAARFAAKHNMEFLEASALDATNVVDAFKKLIVPVGRLLSPTNPHNNIARLPPGWRRVLSRTRPGEYSYENQYTKERIAFAPKEPAKPSQQSFRPLPGPNSASSNGKASTGTITVTRESLQLQHQKAFMAQSQSPQCGVCAPPAMCSIL
ncbi:Rab11 family gtpase [Globisporangium polare]